MKTLVIHPNDPSTDFLRAIYANIECDVLCIQVEAEHVTTLIPNYDRIIMLGHGCPDGLFGQWGLVVDSSHAEVLRTKDVICIWCHAERYVSRYRLKGFYSGMFISEVGEARTYRIQTNQKSVDYSNSRFAYLLGIHIDDPNRLEIIKEAYQLKGSDVVAFNNERLFESDGDWDLDMDDLYLVVEDEEYFQEELAEMFSEWEDFDTWDNNYKDRDDIDDLELYNLDRFSQWE